MTSLFSHLKQDAPKIYLDDVLHTCGDSFKDRLKHLETMRFLRKQVCKSMQTKALGVQLLGFGSLVRATVHSNLESKPYLQLSHQQLSNRFECLWAV